jgi:hypothetical protein
MMTFVCRCRYVLDGDRDELRNIRHELASLRSNLATEPAIVRPQPPHAKKPSSPSYSSEMKHQQASASSKNPSSFNASAIRDQIAELQATGLYEDDDAALVALRESLAELESSSR